MGEPESGEVLKKDLVYLCVKCNKAFPSESYLLRHFNKFHPNEDGFYFQYQCSICSRKFTSKAYYEKHLIEHDANEKCTICSKKFVSLGYLQRHINRFHNDVKEFRGNFPCDECDKSFASELSLKKHQYLHRSNLSCEICSKKFPKQGYLLRHMRRFHKTKVVETQVNCTKQDETNTESEMGQSKSFVCKLCHKTLPSNGYLLRHINRFHMKDKSLCADYFCEKCNKYFTSKTSHEKHMRLHASKFSCRYCKISLPSEGYLRRHLNRFHALQEVMHFLDKHMTRE